MFQLSSNAAKAFDGNVGSATIRGTSRGRRKGRACNGRAIVPFAQTANKTNTDKGNVRVIVCRWVSVTCESNSELLVCDLRAINGTLPHWPWVRIVVVVVAPSPRLIRRDVTISTERRTRYHQTQNIMGRSHRRIVRRIGPPAASVRVDGLGLHAYVTSLFPADRLTHCIPAETFFIRFFRSFEAPDKKSLTSNGCDYQSPSHRILTKFIIYSLIIFILVDARRMMAIFYLLLLYNFTVFNFYNTIVYF